MNNLMIVIGILALVALTLPEWFDSLDGTSE